jgi:hypothetical protein
MSYRERQNRREFAAESARKFAELEALMTQRAQLQVTRPQLMTQLRRGGCTFAAELRGTMPEALITYLESGGCPPALMEAWAEHLDGAEADLSARITAYGDDPGVVALMEASVALGAAEDSRD